jgi:DinB superfamily
MTLSAFLVAQFETEFKSFAAAVEAVPEDQFETPLTAGGHGKLGHPAAWHALHIAEWTRLMLLTDRSPTYGHLGWEDQGWAQQLSAQPRLNTSAGRAAVVAELHAVFSAALDRLRTLTDDQLDATLTVAMPMGERPLLASYGTHLRHLAYHRGQVRLNVKHLNPPLAGSA